MKQLNAKYTSGVIFTALLFFMAACSKEDFNDGSPKTTPGEMIFSSIDKDSASSGQLLTLKGKGVGDIRTIVFDKNNTPAGFYPTLNTESAILFRVPDTVLGGAQNIILTNSAGKSMTVPFKVLAYATVSGVSNYNFTAGSQITLTGNNLDDVSKITFSGSTVPITILSQSKKELTIELPAADINRAKLDIVNNTGTITTTQEFVNIDKAYQIFTDAYGDGWSDNSWGDGAKIYTNVFKTGTASVGKTYAKGNWHLIDFVNWWPGAAKDPAYKFLTVWIKGGSADQTLYLTSDKRPAGFGNSDRSTPLNVPANVWTYFKIPIADANLWATGDTFNQLGFWIAGPEGSDETFYFDDLLLVK